MRVGVVLLVSADPFTIQQLSHALQELSLSNDVCQAAPEAISLLNRRKFDAVIVDLQTGEHAGPDCGCGASLSIERNSGDLCHHRQRCAKHSLPEEVGLCL